LTSSTPIIPSYRGLTIAGNVLEKDEQGEVHHALVTDTTLSEEVEVVYVIRKANVSH
jgi:hypothetical protein